MPRTPGIYSAIIFQRICGIPVSLYIYYTRKTWGGNGNIDGILPYIRVQVGVDSRCVLHSAVT